MRKFSDKTVRPESEDEEIKKGLSGTAQEREAAFEEAYARFARPLAAFIRERVAPTLDGDEVATAVSKTFCGLARYVEQGRFKSEGAISTLLFSIARRKGYDELRRKTTLKRRDPDCESDEINECGDGEMTDDEFATRVTQRLIRAPEIRELWKTAADICAANEIIRQFRLWIGTLPRLQRKVAQAILKYFGDATNKEICNEIAKAGESPPSEASVKSARKQLTEKFKTLIQTQERKIKS
jgi:RNA polymerase sigma factor (sigma-70 family)